MNQTFTKSISVPDYLNPGKRIITFYTQSGEPIGRVKFFKLTNSYNFYPTDQISIELAGLAEIVDYMRELD